MRVEQQDPVDDKVWLNLWLHEKHLDLCLELGRHGYIDVDESDAAIAAGDSLAARVKNAKYAAAFRR